MRVEVLGGVERRRRWSHDDKMRIIEETLAPGARVTEVARRNGIAASVVFRAHACSRRDWSADGSCGPCWQTALSRSALRNYPICYPELTGGCRGKPGVHKPPVKLCLFDSWIESDAIFCGEYG
jgi:transposase